MTETGFGWIGESRRIALRSTIATEITEWSRAWWVRHAPAAIDAQSLDPQSLADDEEQLRVFRSIHGTLALAFAGDDAELVGRHLADITEHDGPDWSRQVGEAALDDLAERVCKRAGLARPEGFVHAKADAGLCQSRFGAFAMQASLGDLQLTLALDRALVDRLAPAVAGKRTGLTARRTALAQQPCRVEALLDFGMATLSQVSDLRVGEVLIGDCGLDEPLILRVEGGEAIAAGYLRRMDKRRAVALDDIDKPTVGNS